MKSLAERHIDRAQRKADNAAFSTQNVAADGVGLAAIRIAEAQAAFAVLTPEQRDELKAVMPQSGYEDSVAEADANAYDAQGNLRSAGIGVVNPLVAPVSAAMAADGFSVADKPEGAYSGNGGWGEPPAPTVDPTEGNAAGVALDAQTGGQGGDTGAGSEGDSKPALRVNMPVAELEKIAADEGVSLVGASNNAERIELIEAKRKG